MNRLQDECPAQIPLTESLLDSYRHWLGETLLPQPSPDPARRAQQLFALDAVVLSHGTEDDPIFCYGNQAALDLWEVDLPTLLSMPSRKSAEPVERNGRSQMLHRGLEQGFLVDYAGVRISASGRRFRIQGATIWNVHDDAGQRVGQAAMFRDWTYLPASP